MVFIQYSDSTTLNSVTGSHASSWPQFELLVFVKQETRSMNGEPETSFSNQVCLTMPAPAAAQYIGPRFYTYRIYVGTGILQ